MENLGLGFTLMGVGMITVFVILLIVIFGSELLIKIINKIAPEAVAPAKQEASASSTSAEVKAVLDAAVAQITGGKGRIVNVTKL